MRRVVFAAVLIGCGGEDVVAAGEDSSGAAATSTGTSTSSSSSSSDDSSSSSSSSFSSSSDDSGSTTYVGESGYEDDGLMTGCAFTCPSLPTSTSGGGGQACDPQDPDSCFPGEKCMPWANDGGERWNATRCAPVSPDPGQHGEPCTVEGSGYSGIDDCDVGVMCWHVDPLTNTGTCNQLCGAVEGAPTCPDGLVCSEPYGYVLPICVTACDPLASACPEGEGCYPAGLAFGCLPSLVPLVPDGSSCEFRTECAPGSFCAEASKLPFDCVGDGCCARFCNTDAVNSCEGCTPYFPELAASPVGYCL